MHIFQCQARMCFFHIIAYPRSLNTSMIIRVSISYLFLQLKMLTSNGHELYIVCTTIKLNQAVKDDKPLCSARTTVSSVSFLIWVIPAMESVWLSRCKEIPSLDDARGLTKPVGLFSYILSLQAIKRLFVKSNRAWIEFLAVQVKAPRNK